VSKETIKVPDIGDASDVEVIEVCVSPGDRVEKDDSLLVLESDKASMEVPSPRAGTVESVIVELGNKVSEGDEILVMSGAEDAENDTDSSNENEAQSTPEKAADADNEASEEAPATESGDDAQATATSDDHDTEQADESSGTGDLDVVVPDIGDAEDAEVIEINISNGDRVEKDDTLIVLESDKASMEIPAPQAGVVKSVQVEVGDKLSEGAPICILEIADDTGTQERSDDTATTSKASRQAADEERVEAPPEQARTTSDKPAASQDTENPPTITSAEMVYAGPAVRLLAREFGVDLGQVPPTGPRGRIVKEDVQDFVKSALGSGAGATAQGAGIPPIPEVDFSKFGKVEQVAMSRLKKLTATAMHRSWLNVPHVHHTDEADITDLEAFRAQCKAQAETRKVKLTPLPFLLKACVAALREYPQFNVSLAPCGTELIQKYYYNIGVAMDTPAGLMVPVVRAVDQKGIWELAEELAALGNKGQKGKLSPEDIQGGCFTVSSLGALGGTGFTPIVNAPEVAILGVSKTQVKPVYLDGEFVPRQLLPLTLGYDHRAVNGVDAGHFMAYLTRLLSDIRGLIL